MSIRSVRKYVLRYVLLGITESVTSDAPRDNFFQLEVVMGCKLFSRFQALSTDLSFSPQIYKDLQRKDISYSSLTGGRLAGQDGQVSDSF